MRRFSINKLLIASPGTKKARIVPFHPQMTVVTGENDTGKSSLLKSIYYCFGAEPRMLKGWQAAATHILVRFEVDGSQFNLLRTESNFTVFDGNGVAIHASRSVTKELGPFLARLFNFGVKLTSQDGEMITPPPAFLFLPFYFDQDLSWINNWSGFERLNQLKRWREDLIEYHVGLKPNEYYDLKGEHLDTKRQMEQAQSEARVVKGIRDQINEKYEEVTFNIDLEEFQEEIKELLVLCGEIQKAGDRIKEKLVELYNSKMEIESQIEIVSNALGELSSDYKFLAKLDDHVDCPTCGAAYEASFAETFGIAVDEGKCESLLQKLRDDLYRITAEIDKTDGEASKYELEAANVRRLLETKRQQVQLKDLIDSESKKKLKSVLESNLEAANRKTFEIQQKINTLKERLAAFTSKEKRAAINLEFKTLMKRYLYELAVHGLTESSYKDFNARVRDQGSDQPRAVLAYGYAILELMRARSSSVFCPIVIDSPIQQEQDAANHVRILEFIRERQPAGSQIILGLVDRKGVDFNGSTIELNNKRQVLVAEQFEEAYAEITPFIKAALEFQPTGRTLL